MIQLPHNVAYPSARTPKRLNFKHKSRQQVGAALLSAMLTVTLVATFASAAVWQQFRSVEVETAERGRQQSWLLLTGALDWARLILREDARAGGTDHLGEPWAIPLKEARLSDFLAANGTSGDVERNAFLSGSITDMQSRLNHANLVEGGVKSEAGLGSFRRLFELLDLQPQAFKTLSENYVLASKLPDGQTKGSEFLQPQRSDQLAWLGSEPEVLALLAPHITILPTRSPVNLNTASALVISASTPGLALIDAERLVLARVRKPFSSLLEAQQSLNRPDVVFTQDAHSVSTRYFEIMGQLWLDQLAVSERSLVSRDGLVVSTVWRARGAALEGASSGSTPRSR